MELSSRTGLSPGMGPGPPSLWKTLRPSLPPLRRRGAEPQASQRREVARPRDEQAVVEVEAGVVQGKAVFARPEEHELCRAAYYAACGSGVLGPGHSLMHLTA